MRLFSKLINLLPLDTAYAHCDIPCGIYDPHVSQIAALTVIRMMDIIHEHAKHIAEAEKNKQDALDYRHGVIRAIKIKEDHAEIVKHEVRVIWGDYFKPEIAEKYPKLDSLVHEIMMLGSKSKQTADRENGLKLLQAVNKFTEIFWETKGKKTRLVTAPYKPEEKIMIPILE